MTVLDAIASGLVSSVVVYPEIAPRLEKAFENAYGDEILIAAREMDCDKNIFPTVYPFTRNKR